MNPPKSFSRSIAFLEFNQMVAFMSKYNIVVLLFYTVEFKLQVARKSIRVKHSNKLDYVFIEILLIRMSKGSRHGVQLILTLLIHKQILLINSW